MKLCSTVCCAVIAVIAALAGCGVIARQTQFMKSVPGVDMSTAELRERVIELGRRESALVEDAVANVHEGTTDPDSPAGGTRLGLAAIPDVQEATVNADPLVAFADLWALALQTELFARGAPGRKRLRQGYVFVERAARDMAKECEKLGVLVFGAKDVPRVQGRVQAWANENPITAGTFARPTASVAPALARAVSEQPQGAVALIASTEDRLALLDARMEMLNKTMLSRIRWTAVLMTQEVLGTADVAGMIRSLEAFVEQERAQIVQDLDRERKLVFANLDGQREAAFRRHLARTDGDLRADRGRAHGDHGRGQSAATEGASGRPRAGRSNPDPCRGGCRRADPAGRTRLLGRVAFLAGATEPPGAPPAALFLPDAASAWSEQVAENTPSPENWMSPVLIVQGENDEVIDLATTEAFAAAACEGGATVEFQLYAGVDHFGVLAAAQEDMLAWLQARLASESPPSTCP